MHVLMRMHRGIAAVRASSGSLLWPACPQACRPACLLAREARVVI